MPWVGSSRPFDRQVRGGPVALPNISNGRIEVVRGALMRRATPSVGSLPSTRNTTCTALCRALFALEPRSTPIWPGSAGGLGCQSSTAAGTASDAGNAASSSSLSSPSCASKLISTSLIRRTLDDTSGNSGARYRSSSFSPASGCCDGKRIRTLLGRLSSSKNAPRLAIWCCSIRSWASITAPASASIRSLREICAMLGSLVGDVAGTVTAQAALGKLSTRASHPLRNLPSAGRAATSRW